jgi:hypothetical protein
LSVQIEDGFFSFEIEIDCFVSRDGTLSFIESDLEALYSLGMFSVEADTGSFIEEVEEEDGCEEVLSMLEDLDRVTFIDVEDSQSSVAGTALTVWRREHLVTSTPQATPALVRPSPLFEVESPVQVRPLLPKRVLELRGSRSFIPRRTILQSSPRQSGPRGDATTSTISSVILCGEGVV